MSAIPATSRAASLAWWLRPAWPVFASGVSSVVLVALLSGVARGDQVPVFLVHLVVMVLTAGAAYLLDDTAKAVTEVVPRSLLRRRATIVLGGVVVLALAWGIVALILDSRSSSVPLVALTWEAAGLTGVALAAAAAVSARGETEPGNLVASALGLFFIGVLITQPLLHVTLLANSPADPARSGWWALTILISVATLVAASRD